ncbi:MAG: replication-relaxation family protein [Bdellovibrionales bacterium]|nr:replication-relaxation family protein [Bdellovibrionales bacterium]
MKIRGLTTRDRKLLELVDSFGMLSSSQIKKLMFGEIDKRTMLRRLRRLENKKVLSRINGLPRGEQTWILTAKGASLIGSNLTIKGVNRNTLEHDILINEVRFALQDIGRHWVSGHKLRKNSTNKRDFYNREEHIIPDSLFAINTNNGSKTVSLELELVAKSKRRYQRVLDLYLDNTEINYLWYVVPSVSIGKKVLQLVDLEDYRKPYDWVMYSILNEIRTNRLKAKLYFKKKTIRLEEFYQTKTRKSHNISAHSKVHSVSTLDEPKDLWLELN